MIINRISIEYYYLSLGAFFFLHLDKTTEMDKETFTLLKKFSKEITIEQSLSNVGSTYFTILENAGMITRPSYDTYSISELGSSVAQHNSWKDYLIHKKALDKLRIEKERSELKVSQFQVRYRYLPFIISGISALIALSAVFITLYIAHRTPKKTPQPKKSTQVNTISSTKANHLDTVNTFRKDSLK